MPYMKYKVFSQIIKQYTHNLAQFFIEILNNTTNYFNILTEDYVITTSISSHIEKF